MEKQPYPNVPVMGFAPGIGKGTDGHHIGTNLLPINSNVGQDEKDTPMAGVESNSTSTPVPPVDSEPADTGPSGMVTQSTAGNTG